MKSIFIACALLLSTAVQVLAGEPLSLKDVTGWKYVAKRISGVRPIKGTSEYAQISADRKKKMKTVPLTMDINLFEDSDANTRQVNMLKERISKLRYFDRAIVLQEKAMAEEDRIGFFLSDNLMHHMIFSIACRSTVWSWLEETNADLERFRWLRAATQVLDNQDIVNEHKQIRRAIAGRDPIEASFLVSKHLHMMFRNQTEVLDQFPEYFETSKLR